MYTAFHLLTLEIHISRKEKYSCLHLVSCQGQNYHHFLVSGLDPLWPEHAGSIIYLSPTSYNCKLKHTSEMKICFPCHFFSSTGKYAIITSGIHKRLCKQAPRSFNLSIPNNLKQEKIKLVIL